LYIDTLVAQLDRATDF